MPKFTVNLTVQRTIVQSKNVDLEIEADDESEALDTAYAEAEKAQYHNLDEKDWDLESIESEGQDGEVIGGDEEDE